MDDRGDLFPQERVKLWRDREDLQLGMQLKERGIAQVLGNEKEEWKQKALESLMRFKQVRKTAFTSEDWKAFAQLPEPHHPNCWGGIWQSFARKKLIIPSGISVKSIKPSSHAHKIELWTWPENSN